MKSNLPDPSPFSKLTAEEARQRPGFYFVTSTVMPVAQVVGTDETAKLVCVMLVVGGKMYICNPTDEVPKDKLAEGLIFTGPMVPEGLGL